MQPVILDCHLNQKEKYFFLPCTIKNTKNRIMHRITGKIGTRSMLILMLSHFSHVRLCATPKMAAHQVPPSLEFSGKNTGVGCHFLLQCMKMKSESEVAQSCPTLSDPIDCSLPGSSIHGIFQARVLEWGAIAFSDVLYLVCFSSVSFFVAWYYSWRKKCSVPGIFVSILKTNVGDSMIMTLLFKSKL